MITSSNTKKTVQKCRQIGPSRQRQARTIPKRQGKTSFPRCPAAQLSSSVRPWVPLSCPPWGGCQAPLPRLSEKEQVGKHSIVHTKHVHTEHSSHRTRFTPNTVHTEHSLHRTSGFTPNTVHSKRSPGALLPPLGQAFSPKLLPSPVPCIC